MSRRRVFHELVPLEKAIEILEQSIELRPRGIERVDLLDALGRVLAVDVYANIDYPPFDRSEVDGYAVRAEDTYGASEIRPLKLEVAGSVKVGEEPGVEVQPGTAVEIATGAPIPRGCNAVLMEEYTHRDGPSILVYRPVAPLENISIAGTDIAYGELVLPRGTRITSFEIGVLAAMGYRTVDVYTKPRVAVISIGRELVPPGSSLRYGQIYDYNGFALTSYLRSLGAESEYLGILPDDEELLAQLILKCSTENYDLIVTSGGTSAGLEDITYRVIDRIGEVLVHGLEVKPGKPTIIGIVGNKVVIGLPGFPFSAMSRALTLVKYVVERLSGVESPVIYSLSRARIAHRVRKEAGKDLYVPVVVVNKEAGYMAIPIPYRSGAITPLLKANAIAIIRRGVEIVEEGSYVDIVWLRHEIPEAVFIGSHDIILSEIVRKAGLANTCKIISMGSLSGLINVSKGYGDIAPIHLLDPDTMTYNKHYVKQFDNLVLLSGYRRRLVLAYQRGNPKNIRGIEDLLREDIRIVNRNRGSGTRTYIDMILSMLTKKIGTKLEEITRRINGYTYEVSSHTGVAAAISQGRADVGICIEYAARLYNLDYISLTWEEYDFAINRQSLQTKTSIQRFIEFLRSDEFKNLIKSFPGYDLKDDTGEIT